jgi:hypothetical protein
VDASQVLPRHDPGFAVLELIALLYRDRQLWMLVTVAQPFS